jgi:hypothetical protein
MLDIKEGKDDKDSVVSETLTAEGNSWATGLGFVAVA